MKKILAIIPARAGSKGIKNKNIKLMLKKPLIYWTIKEAKKSKNILKLIVSTDSKKIKKLSLLYNVDVPFLRPKRISGDKATDYMLVEHAINFYNKKKIFFDYIILLQPTSPLRDVEDIDNCIKLLKNNKIKTIVSFSKLKSQHPNFLYEIKKKKISRYTHKNKSVDTTRQNVDDLYYPEGSIFLSKIDTYLKYKSFYHKETKPYFLPEWKSFEVDDIEDFKFIEQLLKIKKNL